MGIDDGYIDHINGNRLDNRKCNLRPCTNLENSQNKIQKCTNTSGYKGVNFDKTRNKWVAELKYKNRKIFIGRFNDIKEAAFSRLTAEKLLYKNFMAVEMLEVLKQLKEEIDEQTQKRLYDLVHNKLKSLIS